MLYFEINFNYLKSDGNHYYRSVNPGKTVVKAENDEEAVKSLLKKVEDITSIWRITTISRERFDACAAQEEKDKESKAQLKRLNQVLKESM